MQERSSNIRVRAAVELDCSEVDDDESDDDDDEEGTDLGVR